MKRRLLLTLPLWLSLGSAGSALANVGKSPGYTVSAEQLQQAVATRFPLRYPVGGLLDLNVQTPRLRHSLGMGCCTAAAQEKGSHPTPCQRSTPCCNLVTGSD